MILLCLNLLVVTLLSLSPWWVLKREFGGVGVLAGAWGVIDPQGLTVPENLSLGWISLLFWVWMGLIAGVTLLAFLPKPWRGRGLYGLGVIGLLLSLVGVVGFYQAVGAVNREALAQEISLARVPLRRSSPSLGVVISSLYALGLLLLARLHHPGGKAFLVRRRALVVPGVALALAVIVGTGIIWILRPGLGAEGAELSGYQTLVTQLDLVTYTFQLLFSPLTSLSGIAQSLLLATPLIFTGLAVAFAFHAGLFNIGAPGQLTMGAIATMIVGVYLPGPRVLVLPVAVLAAAVGGGLWGAIPGWLKARFGAHEVINTIMLNYIAQSLFLFLISANQYRFFGVPVSLPFKAPGPEGRSQEIRAAARLDPILSLLGLEGSGAGTLSWALPLAGISGMLCYGLLGHLDLRRRVIATVATMGAGWLLGSLLPGVPVEVSSSLASVRLNAAFLIAVGVAAGVGLYLWGMGGGYELRALGLSPKAAEYAGVDLGRKTVVAMAIAGALAGLAATHYVLGAGIDEYRLKQSLPASVGFDGIAVALMGQNTPLGILLTATLFGTLLTGGLELNLQLGISRELVTTLQALIVLFIAAGGFLPSYFRDPLQAAQVEMEATLEQGSTPSSPDLIAPELQTQPSDHNTDPTRKAEERLR